MRQAPEKRWEGRAKARPYTFHAAAKSRNADGTYVGLKGLTPVLAPDAGKLLSLGNATAEGHQFGAYGYAAGDFDTNDRLERLELAVFGDRETQQKFLD